MSIHLENLRFSQKPSGIEFSEHKSIEIEFWGKGSSLDDRAKDIRNLKSVELEILLGGMCQVQVDF
jgi:hypothetical protein